MMRFFTRFFIITTVVATIVELVVYCYVKGYGISLPVFFLAVAGIVIPIMVNIWYWLPKYGIVRNC